MLGTWWRGQRQDGPKCGVRAWGTCLLYARAAVGPMIVRLRCWGVRPVLARPLNLGVHKGGNCLVGWGSGTVAAIMLHAVHGDTVVLAQPRG